MPVSATSSGLPVGTTVPCFMLEAWTKSCVIARASSAGPLRVIGTPLSMSARKPVVWVLAMLLAITRSRTSEAVMPE